MKLSNTTQRRIIMEELKKLESHPTADELYQLVRQRLPQISLGTVYRNLELLTDAGKIQKLELTGKQKRFDGRVERHFHLRCNNCGAVSDIHDESLPEIERVLNGLVERLEIDSYRLELTGQCDACREKAKLKAMARQQVVPSA